MSRRFIIYLCLLGLVWPLSRALASNVQNAHQFAWSNNLGYINFGGVTVGDSSLEGSAWSENKGFILFHSAQGRVLNDGTGNLSGFAWGEQLGWIDFSDVNIDANGKFSGTATGTQVGTINFNCPDFCDVQTDWRPTGAAATPPINGPTNTGGGTVPSVNATNSEPGVNTTNSSPTPPTNSSTEAVPLFDVISGPAPSTQHSTTVRVVTLIAEILALVSAFFVVWGIRKSMIVRSRLKKVIADRTQTSNDKQP